MVATIGYYEVVERGFYIGDNMLIYLVENTDGFTVVKNYPRPVIFSKLQNSNKKISFIDRRKNKIIFNTLNLEALVKNSGKIPEIKK